MNNVLVTRPVHTVCFHPSQVHMNTEEDAAPDHRKGKAKGNQNPLPGRKANISHAQQRLQLFKGKKNRDQPVNELLDEIRQERAHLCACEHTYALETTDGGGQVTATIFKSVS